MRLGRAPRLAIVLAAASCLPDSARSDEQEQGQAAGDGGHHERGRPGRDVNTTGACGDEAGRLCPGVAPGDGRLAHCLLGFAQAPVYSATPDKEILLSPACTLRVRRFFFNAARKDPTNASKLVWVEPVAGFRAACATDARRFCPDKKGPGLIACLKRRKSELGAACGQKLGFLQRHQAVDMGLDTALHDACREDLQGIEACRHLTLTSVQGSRKACLKEHRKELSGGCRSELFRREQEDAEDIRYNVDVFATCKPDIRTFCADQEFGEARMLNCLWHAAVRSKEGEESLGSECRAKVLNLTAHSVQDYRLDFRVSTRCRADIRVLCADEKAAVDNLTVAQLFGGSDKRGLVMRCLKASYAKIQSPKCQSEMQRVVRVQSFHAEADPAFARACDKDIKEHCPAEPPEGIHLCLRKHLRQITAECRTAEVLQGSLEARSIGMKPLLMRWCRTALKDFCGDVRAGEAQRIRCLQDHMGRSEFPKRCKKAVLADLEASNNDWRLKFGISTHCVEAAHKLCEEKMELGAGEVLACLKKSYDTIESPQCKNEMRRYITQEADNVKAAPLLYERCVKDVRDFCAEVQPGGGRVHDCLLDHKANLSEECAEEEFANRKFQADDIRTKPKAMVDCAGAMRKFCPDVQMDGGKMWACLERNQKADGMDSECAEVVAAQMKLKHDEFRLHPGLLADCNDDARTLCPDVPVDSGRKFAGNASLVDCLMSQLDRIESSDCKSKVERRREQHREHWLSSATESSRCKAEQKRFCREFKGRPAEMRECLAEHRANLSSACQDRLDQFVETRTEDIRATPLEAACEKPMRDFCQGVEHGKGRAIVCLLDHMYDDAMDGECREELARRQESIMLHFKSNPVLSAKCQGDLDRLAGSRPACGSGGAGQGRPEGWEVECLRESMLRSAKELSGACQKAMGWVFTRQAADIRARPVMYQACKDDLGRLCANVTAGAGRWHQCLRAQPLAIESSTCRDMVAGFAADASKVFGLNYQVQKNCRRELAAYCRVLAPGKSRRLVCLSLHRNATNFGDACRQALAAVSGLDAMTPKPESAWKLVEELKDWFDAQVVLGEKWGKLLMGSVVGFAAVLTSLVSYCCIRWRYRKKGYSAVASQDPKQESA